MTDIRVRIAPSPSGFLHIGTAKMALFNWLFARQSGGAFILRLEDTDADRTEETFVQAMCEGFHWLGIEWDEGPEFGNVPQKGAHGPYRQSFRKDLYAREIQRLLDSGAAYKCFCTKEELEAMPHQRYDRRWRDAAADQIAEMGDTPYVVRFKVPDGDTVIHDLVQGEVRINNREFDDFIIQRSNGAAMFHLAVVVDDGLMRISHVIRGDDHLTNCAKHVMLFDALGYPLPQFAHLPMVLDERGKKFSKRDHGANVLDWREDGYLAEALINYVALLGWTPADDERVVFSREELIEAFDITRLGASAARFDRKKLDWLNGQHIRRLPVEELRDRVLPILQNAGFDVDAKTSDWLTRMAAICQEKLPTLNAIVGQTDFFFVETEEYEEKAVRKQWTKAEALDTMTSVRAMLSAAEPFEQETIKALFKQRAEEEGTGLGTYVHPTRLALTGKSVGPGLFELAELLGRETCVHRVDRAMAYIQQQKETMQ